MAEYPSSGVLSELGQSVVELRTVLHMHLYGAGMDFLPAHPYPCAMQHKGIEYILAPDHGPHPWAWVAHISPPKSGTARSKIAAMLAARRAIDRWCRDNPTLCAPRVADPIVLSLPK